MRFFNVSVIAVLGLLIMWASLNRDTLNWSNYSGAAGGAFMVFTAARLTRKKRVGHIGRDRLG